jgi:hypothetical protein
VVDHAVVSLYLFLADSFSFRRYPHVLVLDAYARCVASCTAYPEELAGKEAIQGVGACPLPAVSLL